MNHIITADDVLWLNEIQRDAMARKLNRQISESQKAKLTRMGLVTQMTDGLELTITGQLIADSRRLA